MGQAVIKEHLLEVEKKKQEQEESSKFTQAQADNLYKMLDEAQQRSDEQFESQIQKAQDTLAYCDELSEKLAQEQARLQEIIKKNDEIIGTSRDSSETKNIDERTEE